MDFSGKASNWNYKMAGNGPPEMHSNKAWRLSEASGMIRKNEDEYKLTQRQVYLGLGLGPRNQHLMAMNRITVLVCEFEYKYFELFFPFIWPFDHFTDNLISKNISLVLLVFIFGLLTKDDNIGPLATGIFLLAHNTLLSFSAFLKTDAR